MIEEISFKIHLKILNAKFQCIKTLDHYKLILGSQFQLKEKLYIGSSISPIIKDITSYLGIYVFIIKLHGF